MSEHDDLRNKAERETEKAFPGYKGPVWGEYTPGCATPLSPQRTQVSFEEDTYWLDVPPGSVCVGDMIAIAERGDWQRVGHVGVTLNSSYFESDGAVPHKLGTFVQLIRKAA